MKPEITSNQLLSRTIFACSFTIIKEVDFCGELYFIFIILNILLFIGQERLFVWHGRMFLILFLESDVVRDKLHSDCKDMSIALEEIRDSYYIDHHHCQVHNR